jgi:hypothetical protein
VGPLNAFDFGYVVSVILIEQNKLRNTRRHRHAVIGLILSAW